MFTGIKYMIRVLVESPFAGKGASEEARAEDEALNVSYARACLRNCLLQGEAPLASHLLYTQEGVLSDHLKLERALGIEAGLVWGLLADKSIVYLDRGMSHGMVQGIKRAIRENRAIEFRSLRGWGSLVWDALANQGILLEDEDISRLHPFLEKEASNLGIDVVEFVLQQFYENY